MYADIQRLAALSTERYWPVPQDFASCALPQLLLRVRADLLDSGWERSGSALSLNTEAGRPETLIHLDLADWTGQPFAAAHLAAQTLALSLLAKAHISLRQGLRLIIAPKQKMPPETIIFSTAKQAADAGGYLFVPRPRGLDNLVAMPDLVPLVSIRDALRNAGLDPRLCLGTQRNGLVYQAPGRPERIQEEMSTAIKAYASLIYGLAGYGVMAFSFDLDF